MTNDKTIYTVGFGDRDMPSLGDILADALNKQKLKRQTGGYFKTTRVIHIDTAHKIERIKAYRAQHGCTLLEAKQDVDRIIVIELLQSCQTPEDFALVTDYIRMYFGPVFTQVPKR